MSTSSPPRLSESNLKQAEGHLLDVLESSKDLVAALQSALSGDVDAERRAQEAADAALGKLAAAHAIIAEQANSLHDYMPFERSNLASQARAENLSLFVRTIEDRLRDCKAKYDV